MRRWRKVQAVDEAWQYEEETPAYAPRDLEEVTGWRPLATVWLWAGKRDKEPLPWRARLNDWAFPGIQDFETLNEAQLAVEAVYFAKTKHA